MCQRCSGMFECNVHRCNGRTSVPPGAGRYSSGGWQVLQDPARTEPSRPGRAADGSDAKPTRSPSASVT
jgi:hypothetical protein